MTTTSNTPMDVVTLSKHRQVLEKLVKELSDWYVPDVTGTHFMDDETVHLQIGADAAILQVCVSPAVVQVEFPDLCSGKTFTVWAKGAPSTEIVQWMALVREKLGYENARQKGIEGVLSLDASDSFGPFTVAACSEHHDPDLMEPDELAWGHRESYDWLADRDGHEPVDYSWTSIFDPTE